MHFRHISAKIQLKNFKQHFDWGDLGPLGLLWLRPCSNISFEKGFLILVAFIFEGKLNVNREDFHDFNMLSITRSKINRLFKSVSS